MPTAHPALVALVDRALAREKEQRWQSAESMREAIVSLSEMLLGEPETPLMTPLALAQSAAPRRAKAKPEPTLSYDESTVQRGKLAPVADLTEETLDDNRPADETLTQSTRARAAVVPLDDSTESSEDRTRIGAPNFPDVSDGSDTEPNLQRTERTARADIPRLDGGSSDASDEDSSDMATKLHPAKRASWSDLRHAVEQTNSIDSTPDSAEAHTQVRRPQAPTAEHPFNHTHKLASERRLPPASAHHPAVRPSAPSLAPAIPQDRQSVPALIPLGRPPSKTVRSLRPGAASLPYLPIVLAGILLGFSPLAYFLARGCGGAAPPEAQTLPLTTSSSLPITPALTSPTPRVSPPTSQTQIQPAPVVTSSTSAVPVAPPVSIPPAVALPPNPYPASPPQPRAGSHSLPEAPETRK